MRVLSIATAAAVATIFIGPALADPLPSWNPGAAKTEIVAFIEAATTPASDSYIDPAERIAVFDNDGTLWAEQPLYFQLAYALDRVRRMAADDPSIADRSPALRAAAERDRQALISGGHEALLEVIAATHAGMTTDAFKETVAAWLETAKHPETGRLYVDMVYQPMLELLAYLRESGFKTYIVSGGGIDFIRAFSEDVYGVPPEQVVGSSIKAEFAPGDDRADTVKVPELFFYDDKEGKPVAIDHHIGRRPVVAVGNSDGDHQMLQYAAGGPREGLAILVHHTDAEREWAYDRGSRIGALDKALDEAGERGWVVVDMKRDWRTVFPWELGR